MDAHPCGQEIKLENKSTSDKKANPVPFRLNKPNFPLIRAFNHNMGVRNKAGSRKEWRGMCHISQFESPNTTGPNVPEEEAAYIRDCIIRTSPFQVKFR